jgi:hypothetical protein
MTLLNDKCRSLCSSISTVKVEFTTDTFNIVIQDMLAFQYILRLILLLGDEYVVNCDCFAEITEYNSNSTNTDTYCCNALPINFYLQLVIT